MAVHRSTLVASFAALLGCAVDRGATTPPQAVEIDASAAAVTRVPERDPEHSVARPIAPVPDAVEPPLPECPRRSDAPEGACGAESVCGAAASAPCNEPAPRI